MTIPEALHIIDTVLLLSWERTIELDKTATPGPWRCDPTSRDDSSLLIRGTDDEAKWRRSTQLDTPDAAFIAHARSSAVTAARAAKLAVEALKSIAFCRTVPYIETLEAQGALIAIAAQCGNVPQCGQQEGEA